MRREFRANLQHLRNTTLTTHRHAQWPAKSEVAAAEPAAPSPSDMESKGRRTPTERASFLNDHRNFRGSQGPESRKIAFDRRRVVPNAWPIKEMERAEARSKNNSVALDQKDTDEPTAMM